MEDEVVTEIEGLETAEWLVMPNGYVAMYDAKEGVVSGVLRISGLKRWVPEDRPGVIAQTVTGRLTYLTDIESTDLGDDAVEFSARLSDQALMSGRVKVATAPAWVECVSKIFELNEVERRHGLDYLECKYGEECVVRMRGGRELRSPAYPAECDYLRVCVAGMEVAYWDSQEFADDPKTVMGALMGCLAQS